MVTNDERREVARRMRGMAEERFDFCAHNVALEIGLDDPSDFDDLFDEEHEEAWLRLADLIDSPAAAHECVPGECPLNVRHDNDRIDRDALLALADEMEEFGNLSVKRPGVRVLHSDDFSRELGYARRIREACGEGAE